jgi:hypothetical protein
MLFILSTFVEGLDACGYSDRGRRAGLRRIFSDPSRWQPAFFFIVTPLVSEQLSQLNHEAISNAINKGLKSANGSISLRER